MKIGIIGAGNIGSELYRKTKALGWDIKFVLKDDGVYKNFDERIDELKFHKKYEKGIDLAFLAIPTLDDGNAAYKYIKSFIKESIPVVTCEKGALSNYFRYLRPYLDKIGYSATVGGGTRLLRYLEERISPDVKEIHAVINGTLNYIFDEVSRGRSLGEVAEEAKKLGYAEPGAKNHLEVINKEATKDIPMKTSILFNISKLASNCVNAKNIKCNEIGEPELKKLIKESKKRRYIVSISKEDNGEDIIGGFKHKIEDWIISAGFKDISENSLYSKLVPSGVNNSILICEGEHGINGTYVLSGQGAGAHPTASSMIKDAINLVANK